MKYLNKTNVCVTLCLSLTGLNELLRCEMCPCCLLPVFGSSLLSSRSWCDHSRPVLISLNICGRHSLEYVHISYWSDVFHCDTFLSVFLEFPDLCHFVLIIVFVSIAFFSFVFLYDFLKKIGNTWLIYGYTCSPFYTPRWTPFQSNRRWLVALHPHGLGMRRVTRGWETNRQSPVNKYR